MSNQIVFPVEWTAFLLEKESVWQETYTQEFQVHIPLLYDAAFINSIDTLKPWNRMERTIPEVFESWTIIKADLHEKFSHRDVNNILEQMKKGMGLFLEILYWCNQSPVVWKLDKAVKLVRKPVNWEERLEYILANPTKYHSYIQLAELFSEQEKSYVKQQTVMKAKKASKS
ncbi:YpoC family protein [Bacillus tuaregi]|uniref:YpoC family protein n=1 Tax=Bacillus tuaregi TaxID=1816695 RepID=UPI0008F8247C|nr:hypothetical protein [Bacillus tuaregi]